MSKNLVQLAQHLVETEGGDYAEAILALAKGNLDEAERLLRQIALIKASSFDYRYGDEENIFADGETTLIKDVLRGVVEYRGDQESVEIDLSGIDVDQIYYNPEAFKS
jgi:hypothetical protein